MIKKTITFMDLDGNEVVEDFWFNLSKAELTELKYSEQGGLDVFIKNIIATRDSKRLIEMFKKLILMSYGERGLDGKRFVKSEEISTAFSQTDAFTNLFMELVTDDTKAAEFVVGVLPSDLASQIDMKNLPTIAE